MPDLAHDLNNATPFDIISDDISDLYDEAKTWLDGSDVKTQAEADAVATLMDLARKARKAADDARKLEKQPFDDGAKVVQAKFKPLLERADLIIETCRASVRPYLTAQETERQRLAQLAREEAEAADRAAQAAMAQSSVGDIEQREEAERLAEIAKAAGKSASRADKGRTQAATGGKALGLRSVFKVEIADLNAALRHYWKAGQNEADFHNLIMDIASRDVRAGAREIDGVKVIEEKVAV